MTDGFILDNNRAENTLRGVALGRKNWLFAGSDSGGARAAAIYGLIETCKLNGVDPFAYLRDVLGRIADHMINRIDGLLPALELGFNPRRRCRSLTKQTSRQTTLALRGRLRSPLPPSRSALT